MIKWSEEHDSEVNHNIALLTGEEPDKWYPYGGIKGKDYCNNPSDAWPIICANKISLQYNDQQEIQQWSAQIDGPEGQWHANSTRPLRAAMVCFLLSKTCV
ncbi:phage protein NinX family protein [Rouxiella sp. Mn2063]|uniref:phage protein NinX family protein n=1 Tax=Rouxiella sp. Mn2063 TaxID=3395262 RepID=UPI003BC099D0